MGQDLPSMRNLHLYYAGVRSSSVPIGGFQSLDNGCMTVKEEVVGSFRSGFMTMFEGSVGSWRTDSDDVREFSAAGWLH
jgi:hypothetical protein